MLRLFQTTWIRCEGLHFAGGLQTRGDRMAEIIVKVEADTATATLKISWFYGDTEWEPYSIDRDLILEVSGDVRASLQRVVDHGIRDQLQTCGGLLKDLAQRGYRLYEALFSGLGQQGADHAQEIREWLEHDMSDQKIDISFKPSPRIHVPWGLIYDEKTCSLSGNDGDIDLKRYEDFWCLKYSLVSVYSSIPPKGINKPRRSDGFKLVPVAHRSIWDEAAERLNDLEMAVLNKFFNGLWRPVYSKRELIQAWREYGDEIDVTVQGVAC